MTAKKHVVKVDFEAKWGVTAMLVCPFDVSDRTRPCWPTDEDGTPVPESSCCNWKDWFDNADGLENLGGPTRTIRFELAEAEWCCGGYTWTLGPLIAEQAR